MYLIERLRRVLRFVELHRYATSLVLNSKDKMSRFLTGINGDMDEEYRSAILHDNMDLSRLMVHVEQVEDSRRNRGIHDARRPSGRS